MTRALLLRLSVALSVCFWITITGLQAQLIDLTAWHINTTSATGHSTNATINALVSQITADVREVWYTADNVYVKSAGVPSYDVGPFPDGNPAYPSDRNWQLRFARNPQAATGTHTATGLGSIGLLVNGIPIYNPKDAHSYNNQNVWHNNAVVVEASGFDAALGHPSPVGQGQPPIPGAYHHHQLSPSLSTQLGGISSSQFSPLLGFAFDGFPIYGPYGYANADGTGGITRMTSSYQQRSIAQRHALSGGSTLASNQWGPDVSTTYPLGYFIEDYEYVAGLGQLDLYNGRFTVTPDYPSGTFAYFATIDAGGVNAYPYMLGPSYYGVLDTADSTGSVAIPGGAVQYHPGDYNGNGVVDAADYVVWRNDGIQSGYDTWRSRFGQTAGSGSGSAIGLSQLAAVPEPATLWLGLVAAALLRVGRQRRG